MKGEMRIGLGLRILFWLLLCRVAVPLGAAERTAPPRSEDFVRAGKGTLKKIRTSPASWTVKFLFPTAAVLEARVICDKGRRAWSFVQVIGGRPQKLCHIVQSADLWYVEEKDHLTKSRPYEAELHFPSAYLFLSLSDVRCVADAAELSHATFLRQTGSKVSYRLPLPPQSRRLLEQVISNYDRLGASNPSFLQREGLARTIKQARQQLTAGIPLSIDSKTGIIVERRMHETTVTVQDFHWLDAVPKAAFELPKSVKWDDESQPWPDSDYTNCVMVGHDPTFFVGSSAKLAVDGYVLNLRTGQLRRVPFEGYATLPGCFLKDRHEVIVAGLDPDRGMGIVRVDLRTGVNEGLTYGTSNVGLNLMAELSPNGRKIATLRSFNGGSLTDFQIQLIDLKTGKVQNLGKPGQIRGPLSWLPDGTGLILKRYKLTDDLNVVEPRTLCRLDLNGKLTDLRPGDWPVVLRKLRKILYKDNDTGLWHTCNLDGSAPKLFADGLKGYAMPAVSPDEKKIIFAHYERGKLPQLTLFDMGKSKGEPVGHAEGFTSMPTWR